MQTKLSMEKADKGVFSDQEPTNPNALSHKDAPIKGHSDEPKQLEAVAFENSFSESARSRTRTTSFRSSGLGDTYAVSLAGAMDTGEVTVSAWVFLDGSDRSESIKTIVSNRETGCEPGEARNGFAVAINEWETADRQLTLEWADETDGCRKVGSKPMVVEYDRWTHVAATLTHEGEAAVYIDGSVAMRVGPTARRMPQTTASLRVGQYVDGLYPLVGNISSLIIFKVALDEEAVTTLSRTPPGQIPAHFQAIQDASAIFTLTDAGRRQLVDARGREFPMLAYRTARPTIMISGGFAAPSSSGLTKLSREAERDRAAAVKDAMSHAWAGYKARAWGRDELKPISGRGQDNWGAMGVTLVDSLDTLWLMGMKAEFDEAKEWVRTSLSFDQAGTVSVFETTIRELGGLLAAYDLSGESLFLEKADDLGSRLAAAFQTPTGIPRGSLDLRDRTAKDVAWTSGNAVLAELGSLQLEFRYLAAKTGKVEYARQANRVFETLARLSPPNGLFPIYVSPNSGQLASRKITLGALGDSFYEYLLKTWIQGGKTEHRLREMYDTAIDGIATKLLQRSEPSKLAYIADLDGGRIDKMDHLVCFLPGTLALGAHTDPDGLESPRARRDLNIAKALAHTCFQMYDRMSTKLSPEFVTFQPGGDFAASNSAPFYILRPETAESLFVLYHLTGDPIYRDRAWQIFQAIVRHCKTAVGFGSLQDVRRTGSRIEDRMESFFLAETLKYLYLVQADPDHGLSLSDIVFNTEAHPISILGPTGIHVSQNLQTPVQRTRTPPDTSDSPSGRRR